MADSALSSDPLERYAAIERAYCEELWMAVIHDGQSLLGDLERAEEPAPQGLKERLQLLIGHAFLYGIGDRDSAEDLYQAVLGSGAEPSLRQIAEQGLQQCSLPVVATEVEVAAEVLEQQEQAAGVDASDSAAASLWREPGTGAGPGEATIAAELSAIPSAAPPEPSSLSGTPSDGRTPAEPPDSSVQVASLSWLTAETPTAPQDSASQPVMPWLQGAASPSSPPPPMLSEQRPSDWSDLAPVQEQPQPAADDLSSSPSASWLPSAAAPVQGETASSADSLAAIAPSIRPQDPGDSSGLPDALPAVPEPEAAVRSSPMASPPELRLAVDVVDEPELIELHQATGQVEEALLLPIDAESQPLSPPESAMVLTAQPWLPGGPDRRGVEPVLSEPAPEPSLRPELDRPDLEPISETPPPSRIEQAEEPESASATAPAATAAPPDGRGPFSAPPEPVAEEDPELLMGLLKLEMG